MTKRAIVLLLALFAHQAAARAGSAAPSQAWFGLGFTCHAGASACDALVVAAVAPKGPAERGGVRAHDVITKINGRPARFAKHAEALARFRQFRAGEKLRLELVRDGRTLQVTITGEQLPPEFADRLSANETLARQRDGARNP